MKKVALLFIINVVLFGQAFAQTKIDPELQKLTKTVATLRNADEKTWNKALDAFGNDSLWTTMDEVARDENECWLVGNNQFKLNAILNRCNNHEKKMVRGDFLNGNDPHYNYSLTERGIKSRCSVSYEMSYREGRQTFVVMPYNPKTAQLEVKAYLNDKPVGESSIDNGDIVLSINSNIIKSDTIRLVVTNRSDEDMPVVIINHNSRKQ